MFLVTQDKTNFKYIVIVGVLVLIAGAGILWYWQIMSWEAGRLGEFYEVSKIEEPTDETANWKTYRNDKLGIEFKYPEFYSSIKETEGSVSLGEKAINGDIFYLIISNNLTRFTDYKSYKPCLYSDTQPETMSVPCLSKGEHWGQEKDITEIKLGGINAKSFYITELIGADYHVVQTTTYPYIEAKMFVAGGGLDKSFDQILSTFRFLE